MTESPVEIPSAPDAEAAILCCIIEYPKRFAPMVWEAQISADYFHHRETKALWEIVADRLKAGLQVDPVSISEIIRDTRPNGLTAGLLSKTLLAEFAPESWGGYIETLRDRYARRLAIQAGLGTAEDNDSGQEAVARLRKAAEMATEALAGSSAILDAKTSISTFMATMDERMKAGALPGMGSGMIPIDEKTGGLRKGELWVIGAKTSMGKSVFMLQVAGHALSEGKRVAIFSLEMGADEIVGRLIASTESVSLGTIFNPKGMSKLDFSKIRLGADKIEASKLLICDRADMTMEAIAGHCQRLADSAPLDLVVIDYLQLISTPKIKGQNREQEVAGISRACKQLAKRLKCPVITATQLNEQGQARESRAIEHDADSVLFIVQNKDDENQTVQFWKCRNGKRGDLLKARLNGEFQRFTFY